MRNFLTLCALAAGAALSGPAAAQVFDPALISPEMILGHWSDDGDCSRGVLIRPDGTFLSFDHDAEGEWTLDGDRLTFSGDGGEFELRLLDVEADGMTLTRDDGSIGYSVRCPDEDEEAPYEPFVAPIV